MERPEENIMLLPLLAFFSWYSFAFRQIFQWKWSQNARANLFNTHTQHTEYHSLRFISFRICRVMLRLLAICSAANRVFSASSSDRLVLCDIIFCLHLHHYASGFAFFSVAPEMAISQSTEERHQRDNELIASKSDETHTNIVVLPLDFFIVELSR